MTTERLRPAWRRRRFCRLPLSHCPLWRTSSLGLKFETPRPTESIKDDPAARCLFQLAHSFQYLAPAAFHGTFVAMPSGTFGLMPGTLSSKRRIEMQTVARRALMFAGLALLVCGTP